MRHGIASLRKYRMQPSRSCPKPAFGQYHNMICIGKLIGCLLQKPGSSDSFSWSSTIFIYCRTFVSDSLRIVAFFQVHIRSRAFNIVRIGGAVFHIRQALEAELAAKKRTTVAGLVPHLLGDRACSFSVNCTRVLKQIVGYALIGF